ncbi:MFS transporter [Mycobacterium sp. GA-2829]|uniref:MFS transporter n=1 Tax=Mycobacterium sp. GA-2829 TaxID=1772283 RepID=UPI000740003D|nr:MFS transporter [Mycobacterium sp. GA-2829]KUI27903.1 hypothetical protein AU194_07740 [Mycobacterium sp. GA-2829]
MTTKSVPAARPRRAALAALAGTSIEWYDFFIYATAAALVFREVFFPPDMDPVLGTIVAFGTTSFGYLGRPLGAFIFGHLGDKYGRKPVLIATLLLMGIGTFGIGLLPSYESVGPVAPLLLIILRLLQGVAMGGEWGGAALLAIEHAPKDRRAFFGSFAQLGSSVGATLSSAVFAVSEHIGDGLAAGSWRIPFLASAVLVVIGLIVRLIVGESPEFARAREAAELSTAPVREVFRAPRTLLIGIGAMLVATGGYYVTSSFFLSYASEEAGVPVDMLLNALIIAGLFEIMFVPLAGWLGDKWQPRYVTAVGLIGIAVVAVPLYLLAHTGSFAIITLMLIITALFTGFNYGPIAAVLAGIFPVRVRYTGTSLAYQGAALTAGALTPIVLPTLLGMSSGSPVLIFAYLAVMCFVAAGCVLATRQLAAAAKAADTVQETAE